MNVTALTAEIDVNVIGSGVDNPASVLQTSMQQFEGKKDAAKIVGKVQIKSQTYDGSTSPAFPVTSDTAGNEQWLKPSQFIESDHEPIVDQAKRLTEDAKNWWDATKRIGTWVENEIRYTIADTPSARLALEKKCGDCGPHSTLTVAMLRAVGIPGQVGWRCRVYPEFRRKLWTACVGRGLIWARPVGFPSIRPPANSRR